MDLRPRRCTDALPREHGRGPGHFARGLHEGLRSRQRARLRPAARLERGTRAALRIDRDATKLIIKLTQPDARKSMGNGRHYSNAIGFYILKGNEVNAAGDHKRRKLLAKDGDEEDGGDFVFTKEPRYSRQVTAEYTLPAQLPPLRADGAWPSATRVQMHGYRLTAITFSDENTSAANDLVFGANPGRRQQRARVAPARPQSRAHGQIQHGEIRPAATSCASAHCTVTSTGAIPGAGNG